MFFSSLHTMTESTISQTEVLIKNRRTVKAASMNGTIIPNETILKLLNMANWAPTHGRTEPWYFYIYTGESLKEFGKTHAQLYWDNTSEENRKTTTFDNLQNTVDKVSHLIIGVMKRGSNPKIPILEEIASASAAIQNLLLGASAADIAAIWNTGGMTHHQAMKDYLKLNEDDIVLGLIYLGYTDEPKKEGVRTIPMENKIKWM